MIKIPLPLALVFVAFAAFFSLHEDDAHATGERAMLEIMSHVPMNAPSSVWSAYASQAAAVGPGFVDSFKITCASNTATEIVSPLAATGGRGRQISYTCQTPQSSETNGTVLVAVGDSTLGNPAFATRTSPVYSGSTIREWGGNTSDEYCKGDAAAVDVFCRSLISASGQP
jgi:hypothetical protein